MRETGSLRRVDTGVQSRQEVDYAHRVRLRSHGIRLAGDGDLAPVQHARAHRGGGGGAPWSGFRGIRPIGLRGGVDSGVK